MATKITELTAMTTAASADVLPIVDDPAGTPLTQKITAANLAASIRTLNAATMTGADAAVVADDNLVGGIPVVHRLSIANQASGNVDYVLTHKTRVIDVWVVKTGADGHESEDTITVQNGANAITNAMAIGQPNDTGITRAANINDANHDIAAAGTLRVAVVRGSGGGNDTACEVYVMGLRVA